MYEDGGNGLLEINVNGAWDDRHYRLWNIMYLNWWVSFNFDSFTNSFSNNASESHDARESNNNSMADIGNKNLSDMGNHEAYQMGSDKLENEAVQSQQQKYPWDLNGDGILQKNEADSWYLYGKHYNQLFKNRENYYIIDKNNNKIFGPLKQQVFYSFMSKKDIKLEFK